MPFRMLNEYGQLGIIVQIFKLGMCNILDKNYSHILYDAVSQGPLITFPNLMTR